MQNTRTTSFGTHKGRSTAVGVKTHMSHTFALAFVLSTVAQAPSPDAIAKQLNAADSRTIAWGAYNAAAYNRVEAIPRLQQILESPPLIDALEKRAFMDVVMDSLIQLNAKVPARLLVPYVGERPIHTSILLSRATDREAVLLELLARLSGNRWFAAANVLLEDRSPGLAEHLVRNLKLQLIIHVADSENVAFGVSGGMSVGIGCGIGQDPPGYPPHAEYTLGRSPQAGSIVLAAGPQPVYYSRTVASSFQYGVSEATITGPDDEDRIIYLRAMSPDTGGIPFRAQTVETVVWSTPDAFSRRVRELRALVEQRFRHLIDRGRQFQYISPDLLVQPAIEVLVMDRRSDKTVPLPQFVR